MEANSPSPITVPSSPLPPYLYQKYGSDLAEEPNCPRSRYLYRRDGRNLAEEPLKVPGPVGAAAGQCGRGATGAYAEGRGDGKLATGHGGSRCV